VAVGECVDVKVQFVRSDNDGRLQTIGGGGGLVVGERWVGLEGRSHRGGATTMTMRRRRTDTVERKMGSHAHPNA
jgi:hypothetical protein